MTTALPTRPAVRLLPVLLRVDAAFNLLLGAAVLVALRPLADGLGMDAGWPLAAFALACLDNAAVCWWASRPGAPATRTRLTAGIDLVLAAVVVGVALLGPAPTVAWAGAALLLLAVAAVAVAAAKLALAARR